jgi:hypothetical protein
MKIKVFLNSWFLTGFLAAGIVCILLFLYSMRYEPSLFIYASF